MMLKLFLVDDSVYIRLRVARMLSELSGVQIIGEAIEASGAIQAIRQLKPDVVLVDVHLNGEGTGIDVLRSVKQDKPAPIVIVLTNYPYPQYQSECLSAGADFFFDQSTQFDQVVPVVKKILRDVSRRNKSVPARVIKRPASRRHAVASP